VRVSNAERDRVVARLGDETVAGRLTVDELEARVAAALRARTRRDLNRTQRGLPRDRSVPQLAIRVAVLVVTILWLVTLLLVCALVAVARHLHAHRPARRHALPRA
jgi:Domain of unknown function (DUF1707)